ncbi:hypothetical protein C8R45DRAFT_1110546 [Mycena sanguinolenta]|nr:hypothetical protein C8R45DRAFT_1110546 [Mycena sanguinolenta]
MLNGVHKPDAANKETRLLERRHAGPRPTLAASSARPRQPAERSRAFYRLPQMRLQPASHMRLLRAARRLDAACHLDSNARAASVYGTWTATILFSPPIVWDAARECFFRSPTPVYLATSRSPGRVPVPLQPVHLREIAPAPARIRGPSAYQTPRATAHCVHGQHDVSATRRRKPTGRTTIWKSQCDSSGARAARAGTALVKTSGKRPARAMRAPAAVRPEGDPKIAKVGTSRNSARAPGRTTHVPALQDVDGVTIPRSAWLT